MPVKANRVQEDAGNKAEKHDGAFVTTALRRAIINGEMVPNQRLVEADLEKMFRASRAAVRFALVNLAAEGLVERIQNRGARVRSVDPEEALEIVELRAALESICARKAAERADENGLERLREIAEWMKAAVTAGDSESYSKANHALHRLVLEFSGMKIAPEIVQRLRAQHNRYNIRLAQTPGRPAVSLPEHLAIIDAITKRDPERAEAAMKTHLTSVGEATKRYLS